MASLSSPRARRTRARASARHDAGIDARIDGEPPSRGRRPVAEPRIEALAERVEHRQGVASHVGRDVEMLEERRRDPLPPDLGRDGERGDGADANRAAAEPGLEREEERLGHDVVAAERDDEIGEVPQRICREIAPSLGGRALVGERREVDLEDPIEVLGRRGAETQVLGAHGFLPDRRSPQIGPFEVEDVRPEAMATEQAHAVGRPVSGSVARGPTSSRAWAARSATCERAPRRCARLRRTSAAARSSAGRCTRSRQPPS